MRSRITTLLLSTLLLALPQSTTAQWTNDPWNGMVTVCDAEDEQDYIRICPVQNDRYFIGFVSGEVDQARLRYQILRSTGHPLFTTDGMPLIDGDWTQAWTYSDVMPDGEGGCIAVFYDNRTGEFQIYGQRIDCDGNRLWGPTGLPLAIWPTLEEIGIKDVTFDSLGGFYLAYIDDPYDADLYAQKFTIDGLRLWGDYGVPVCVENNSQGGAQIVPDGQGGLLLAWRDRRSGGSTYYLYFQHLDSDGNPLLQTNGVPVYHYQTTDPMEVDWLWDGVTDGIGGGIWARTNAGPANWLRVIRLDGLGNTLSEWVCGEWCVRYFCDMKRSPVDGSVWIASSEDRGGGLELYLYRFTSRGTPTFGPGLLCGGHYLVPTSDGMITLRQEYENPVSWIRAIRVDSSGSVAWVSNVAIDDQNWGFSGPVGVPDGEDGAICSFVDNRNVLITDFDISAQRILQDGNLGVPMKERPRLEPMIDAPRIIGFDNLIQFKVPEPGMIRLELFDLMGRKVTTLEKGYREPGIYTTRINPTYLPSGIYLLHLTTTSACQTAKIVIAR